MIERLAYSLGRKDEKSNIDLAIELVNSQNKEGITEIVEALTNKEKGIANSSIKVLYEIGYRDPALISDYTENFINLLTSKNNRLVWGGMTALSTTATLQAEEIAENFDKIVNAYQKGSAITVDASITVFAEIAKANINISEEALELILKHLTTCRPKEIPQHSERAFVCINDKNAREFKHVIENRIDLLSTPQLKRVKKILTKIDLEQFE